MTAQTRWNILLIVLFTFTAALTAQDKEWRPVTPEELAAAAPRVEPDADAEATFWEVRLDDSSTDDLSLRHYVRVKIFTERGREKYSKFDVPFQKGLKVKDLTARVTRADGSTVEIKKEDIFEREIIKAGGVKIKAKSFAVPNIEPGVIIEYRYKEVFNDASAIGMQLMFQRDIPVQKLAYYYKPYNKNEPEYHAYNFSDAKFVKQKDGFWLASRTDVPSFKEEPRMPPDGNVRAWMLLTKSRINFTRASEDSIAITIKDPSNPSLYWSAVGTERTPIVKFMNKENAEIKKTALEITAGATSAEDKLKKIYAFCQQQISNTSFDVKITDEQRAKLPPTKSIADVLKRKSGNSGYIDMLFGALANANGFEVRIAYIGDRSRMFIEPQMTNENLIHPGAIGVKVNNTWKYYNPGVPFLPYGMLSWYEEDNWALLVGETRYDWKKTPFTTHGASASKRTGKFTLTADGVLEGTVQIELNGQPALQYRLQNYDEGDVKVKESLEQEVKERVSGAEVSDVSVENIMDNSKPVIQKFTVRVPNYAQKTGKRLFLQAGFFEYGKNPLFSASTRKYDVFFQYPWAEIDHVEVTYPEGYVLDNPDAPGNVSDPGGITSLDISMKVDRPVRLLTYDRKFFFGGNGTVLFDAAMYKPLKGLFDMAHKANSHAITLKQQ